MVSAFDHIIGRQGIGAFFPTWKEAIIKSTLQESVINEHNVIETTRRKETESKLQHTDNYMLILQQQLDDVCKKIKKY